MHEIFQVPITFARARHGSDASAEEKARQPLQGSLRYCSLHFRNTIPEN